MNYKKITNNLINKIEERQMDNLNALEIIKLNGYEVIRYSNLEQYDPTIREAARKIVRCINKSSDLIGVIACGIQCHLSNVRYFLAAPFTTAKIDVEFVLKQLINLEIVNDFYYSEHSNSYLVDLNCPIKLNIDDVLRIGLTEYISKKHDAYINLVAKKNTDTETIDITFVKGDVLFLIHTAFDVDLVSKSVSYNEKLFKLKHTVVNERMILNSVTSNEIWIVSDFTKKQLNPLNNVMSIGDLINFKII